MEEALKASLATLVRVLVERNRVQDAAARPLVQHAWLLREAGRVAEAALLARTALEREGPKSGALQVLGRVAVSEGRFEEAVTLANDPRGDENTRLSVGVQLYNAKQVDRAWAVMSGVRCPAEQSGRETCDKLGAARS